MTSEITFSKKKVDPPSSFVTQGQKEGELYIYIKCFFFFICLPYRVGGDDTVLCVLTCRLLKV